MKIGEHDGLMYYTLGQRQGLKIGGVANRSEEPWYAAKKDLEKNILIAIQGHNHPLLMSNHLGANQMHWVSGKAPSNQFECFAKTRYRQPDQKCMVRVHDNGDLSVSFNAPQRAVTPGQSLVLYQDDICLGGGVITQYG